MKILDGLLEASLVRLPIFRTLVETIGKLSDRVEKLEKTVGELVYVATLNNKALKQHNVLINDLYERQNIMVKELIGIDVDEFSPSAVKDEPPKSGGVLN